MTSLWRRFADGVENPIVVKEGISRMRTWRAPVVATIYLALIGGVGYAWLNIGAFDSYHPAAAQVGQQAFSAMTFFQLALVCLFSPALAAGAISGERERQTLDVLLVSRVTAFGIVWGKLVASMAYVLLLVLTALPLFAAVFLFGGVDFQQLVLTQLITVTTGLFLGSIAVFYSALFQRSLAATVTSYATTFVYAVGTALVGLIVGATESIRQASVAGPQFVVAGEWYLNPFFALASVLFPSVAPRTTLRGYLQVLFFGLPSSGSPAVGGPQVEPWAVCISFEAVLAVAAISAAVLLVRGRRAFGSRRRPAAALPAEAPSAEAT